MPPVVSSTGPLTVVYYSGPLWTYTASSATTVTWSNQSQVIPSQTVTFTAGVTSSPQWNAARVRHVAYRMRNESVLRSFPSPQEQWQHARESIEAQDARERAREEWDQR